MTKKWWKPKFPKQSDYALFPLHDDPGESMSEYETLTDGFGMKIREVKIRDVPWSRTPIADGSPAWLKAKQRMQQFLFNNGITADIDEVAIMFHSAEDKAAFLRDAVSEKHVKHFNSADDFVHTSPIPSSYSVEYDFLEVTGLGMRVEAMYIDRGTSPLHDSLLAGANPTINRGGTPWNMPIVVHFSFKTKKADYETVRAAMVGGGAELVQACHSTYGQFSYYRVPTDDETGHSHINVYLKPRINTRDPEPPSAPSTSGAEFGHPGVGGKYSADALGLQPPKGRPIRDEPQA